MHTIPSYQTLIQMTKYKTRHISSCIGRKRHVLCIKRCLPPYEIYEERMCRRRRCDCWTCIHNPSHQLCRVSVLLQIRKQFQHTAHFAFSHKLHTYTDVHGFASQPGLCGVRVLRSVAKCTAQHTGHLNIRLVSIMLYSKQKYGIINIS